MQHFLLCFWLVRSPASWAAIGLNMNIDYSIDIVNWELYVVLAMPIAELSARVTNQYRDKCNRITYLNI